MTRFYGRQVWLVVLLAISLGSPSSPGHLRAEILADILLIGQRSGMWCWVASTEMVLDGLESDAAIRADRGQCSLVSSVRSACVCRPGNPDALPIGSGGACGVGNSYNADEDYVPELFDRRVKVTGYREGPVIHRRLAACEVQQRRRPLIVWWKDLSDCKGLGHLAVVAGYSPHADSPDADLVRILDPWPVHAGDVYWLSWRGFSCGRVGAGHCVDYYGFGEAAETASCFTGATVEMPRCRDRAPAEIRVDRFDDLKPWLEAVLGGPRGPELLAGLGLHEDLLEVACDARSPVRETLDIGHFFSSLPSSAPTARRRYICSVKTRSKTVELSLLLYEERRGSQFVAGFGAPETTLRISEARRTLDTFRRSLEIATWVECDDTCPELEEVVVVGRGERFLVDRRLKDPAVIPIDRAESRPPIRFSELLRPGALARLLGSDWPAGCLECSFDPIELRNGALVSRR